MCVQMVLQDYLFAFRMMWDQNYVDEISVLRAWRETFTEKMI